MGKCTSCAEPTYEGLKPLATTNTPPFLPRAEPTYEGLKRAHEHRPAQRPPWCGAYLRGIETLLAIPTSERSQLRAEPTYEGLKRRAGGIGGAAEAGAEPTYEGLKQLRAELDSLRAWVRSLPTRD